MKTQVSPFCLYLKRARCYGGAPPQELDMRNLIFAFLGADAVFAALYFPGLLGLGESIVPGVLAFVAVYYFLARRVYKAVEGVFSAAAKHLQQQPPKLDLAISTLESARKFVSYQFGVRSQIDAQIGVIYFLQKEFKKSQPYLESSISFGHWLGAAMLAVIHYKKKRPAEMKEALEVAVKKGKKEALAWNLYAYLMVQSSDRDAAQAVLIRGVKATKDNENVKSALLAVQNNKKIKMKAFKEQWYQFHLEQPPKDYQQVQMRQKISKAQRRGR